MRLAEPLAAREGVTLSLPEPTAETAVLVVADQTALWSGLEAVVRAAILRAGRGGRVGATLAAEGEGLALAVSSVRAEAGADGEAPSPGEGAEAEALLTAAGARLVEGEDDGAGATATIRFAPERCVPLP
jgi:hypothetical protein